jgi:hypothetical protein
LEVAVAFVGFFLALLVVRRSWVWRILECSPQLVALLGGVVALQMPGHFSFSNSLKPLEVFFELSSQGAG